MATRNRSARRGETGFVLVGVVIFVLALTIIGISLFSLSSYEAQFLQRSIDGEQAFQSAVGGIERAKFALSVPPYSLLSASQNLPEGVDSTVAIQDGNSTGAVAWGGTDVMIRVTAEVNGAQRTVEGRFLPIVTQNYYSKVITTSREIVVDAFASVGGGTPTDRRYTVNLLGAVWEGVSPPDTTWEALLLTPPDSVRTSPVPTPDLAAYFTSHPVSAATPAPYDPSQQLYTLLAPENDAEYFRAPSGHSWNDFYYSNWTHTEIRVQVQGLAVWEFPRGLRFDGLLRVSALGGGNSCLVIVAGQAGPQPTTPENDPEMGIRLFSGLIVEPGISVILVSNGRVYLQHLNNASGISSIAGDLTIYAQNAWLTGSDHSPPAPLPQKTMTLQHAATGDLDTKYVDLLASLGALPGTSSASGRSLTLVPGTWHASDR